MTYTTPEHHLLERLLAWNKKWPKAACYMSENDIKKSECELDDIVADAQELLDV